MKSHPRNKQSGKDISGKEAGTPNRLGAWDAASLGATSDGAVSLGVLALDYKATGTNKLKSGGARCAT